MKRLSTRSTFLNALLCVIFLLFAFVQLNDPDPVVWFLVYLITAILCAISIFRKIPLPLLFGFVLVLLFFTATHVEYFIEWFYSDDRNELFGEMQSNKPYLEGTREFMGLVIALLVVLFLVQQQKTHPLIENGS